MIENKPGIYNAPSFYNAKGVYNGETVYNEGGGQKIKIIDHYYGITRINGLLWTTSNLRERVTNVEVIYPNNDQNNEEKDGLLYVIYDFLNYIVPLLPSGWFLPSMNNYKSLQDNEINMPVRNYLGRDIGGYNRKALNLRLNGYRDSNGVFKEYGNYFSYWTSTLYSSNITKVFEGQPDSQVESNTSFANSYGNISQRRNTSSAVRLCCLA